MQGYKDVRMKGYAALCDYTDVPLLGPTVLTVTKQSVTDPILSQV